MFLLFSMVYIDQSLQPPFMPSLFPADPLLSVLSRLCP
jgi:hypothetical protein